MEIKVIKESSFSPFTSHVYDTYRVLVDGVVFAEYGCEESAITFTHGLRAAFAYDGKSVSIVNLINHIV